MEELASPVTSRFDGELGQGFVHDFTIGRPDGGIPGARQPPPGPVSQSGPQVGTQGVPQDAWAHRSPILSRKVHLLLRINNDLIRRAAGAPGTSVHAECMRRVQANLTYLHALSEGKTPPAPLPAIVTAPPETPELNEAYRHLQGLKAD